MARSFSFYSFRSRSLHQKRAMCRTSIFLPRLSVYVSATTICMRHALCSSHSLPPSPPRFRPPFLHRLSPPSLLVPILLWCRVIHLLRFLITSSGPDPPSRPRHVPPPTSPQDPPLQAAAGALPGRRPAGPVAADLGLVRPGPRGPAAGGHGRGLSHALHSVSLPSPRDTEFSELRVPSLCP